MSSRAVHFANEIDWRNPFPAYERIAVARMQNLKRLADSPGAMESLLAYYLDGHWAEFISDWGWTFDPREKNQQIKYRPFILTLKQIAYVDWLYEHFIHSKPGLARKHRDAGLSWIDGAVGVLLWLARKNTVILYGSQTEDHVDNGPGDPDSIFWKIRTFIEMLPKPMVPVGWEKASKHMLVVNPTNGAVLKGDVGDKIGRGGRSELAFADEFAEVQHPIMVESSLVANSDCRIYGSTIPTSGWKGSHFWRLEQTLPEEDIFIFQWFEDARKRLDPNMPPEKERWYVETKARVSEEVFKTQYLMIDDASSAVQFVDSNIIIDANNRRPSEAICHPKLAWRVGVDAAGQGNDKIKIWARRGRINKSAITLQHLDGIQLAKVLQDVVSKLLVEAPVELVCLERDGPGASCADQLKYTSLAPITVAVHTGAKTGDGHNYNLRAWLHQQAKDYLQDEQPVIPYSKTFLTQATAIHYTYKGGLLLIESKDEYRTRFAAGRSRAEKLASRSPDEWDSFVLSFAPPRGRPLESLVPKFKQTTRSSQRNAYALN